VERKGRRRVEGGGEEVEVESIGPRILSIFFISVFPHINIFVTINPTRKVMRK